MFSEMSVMYILLSNHNIKLNVKSYAEYDEYISNLWIYNAVIFKETNIHIILSLHEISMKFMLSKMHT